MRRNPLFRARYGAAVLTIVALGAALVLSACGSSKSTGNASALNTGLTYAECMRAHGVPNFPDPQAGGGFGIQATQNPSGDTVNVNGTSVDAPAFKSASLKCQRDIPGARGNVSAASLASLRTKLLKIAQCMRSHGAPDYPDPQVSAGPGGHGIGIKVAAPGINLSGPAVQAAEKVCGGPRGGLAAKVLGGGPPPNGGTSSSGAAG